MLKILDVKHTHAYTSRYFNEHPHKYNLFGLSSMLSEYGIENVGIKVLDKNEIHSIATPFIAHIGDDFVIVEKVAGDEIQFLERGKSTRIPSEEFFKIWTGHFLVAVPDEYSIEPDYGIHSKKVILSFLPSFIPYLFIINLLCLPYSFWRIWYQKFKAKQWCPLCLAVMLLLWGIFITNIGFGYIGLSTIIFLELMVTGSVYVLSVLTINLVVPLIARSSNMENTRFEINSIKADEEVFKAQLRKQPRYEVSKDTSRILLGNPDSNILMTVFSNPHCNPCSLMHKRINNLLGQNKHVCVQYIFSSFNKELEISNKYLIGTYFQKNGEAMDIYDQWFEKGKFNKDDFFQTHPVNVNTQEVEKEFHLHDQWKEQSGLRATPTILVNGYKLPNNFKIEDMHNFMDTNIQ